MSLGWEAFTFPFLGNVHAGGSNELMVCSVLGQTEQEAIK